MIIWHGVWKYDDGKTDYYRVEIKDGMFIVKSTHKRGDEWRRSQRDTHFPPNMSLWYGFTSDRLFRLELLS